MRDTLRRGNFCTASSVLFGAGKQSGHIEIPLLSKANGLPLQIKIIGLMLANPERNRKANLLRDHCRCVRPFFSFSPTTLSRTRLPSITPKYVVKNRHNTAKMERM